MMRHAARVVGAVLVTFFCTAVLTAQILVIQQRKPTRFFHYSTFILPVLIRFQWLQTV
jgi:hypothetical protein